MLSVSLSRPCVLCVCDYRNPLQLTPPSVQSQHCVSAVVTVVTSNVGSEMNKPKINYELELKLFRYEKIQTWTKGPLCVYFCWTQSFLAPMFFLRAGAFYLHWTKSLLKRKNISSNIYFVSIQNSSPQANLIPKGHRLPIVEVTSYLLIFTWLI